MVARCGKLARQAAEPARSLMPDRRSLAVHQLPRVNDLAAEGLADALVSQADAEDGDFPGKFPDQRHRDAGLVRRAGSRGNHDAIRFEPGDVLDRKSTRLNSSHSSISYSF